MRGCIRRIGGFLPAGRWQDRRCLSLERDCRQVGGIVVPGLRKITKESLVRLFWMFGEVEFFGGCLFELCLSFQPRNRIYWCSLPSYIRSLWSGIKPRLPSSCSLIILRLALLSKMSKLSLITNRGEDIFLLGARILSYIWYNFGHQPRYTRHITHDTQHIT